MKDMTMRHLFFLLLLALPLSACNLGPGSGSDDDDSADDDDDATSGAVETTISAITAGDIETETAVIVTGVVTTRWFNDEGDNEAGFWIQDGSGPGTGMLVFSFFDVSTDAVMQDLFEPGDAVSVEGIYRKPFDFGEIVIDDPSDVTKTGEGVMPDAHVVDAADIASGFADDDLIGVLVAIEDVTVDTSPGWNNYFEWMADDVIIDAPLFTAEADGRSNAWTYPDVFEGYLLDRVTGVLHKDFGDAKLFTRWLSDVDFKHPGCDASWTGTDNLPAVRCNATPGTEVDISDLVVVSGEPRVSNAFFVQDPTADAFAGIEVFSFNEIAIPDVGTTVDVSGEYSVFNGQAELVVQGDSDIAQHASVAATPLAVADACTLGDLHEGMLVSIASVEVDAQDADGTEFGYHMITGCPLIRVGGFFFDESSDFADATGGAAGEVVNLVGIVTDNYNNYAINPRSSDDWDSWGN
jgi:hypothetical protein